MEFTIPTLLTRMDDLLNDVARSRWTEAMRRRWLLDAQQAIIGADPLQGSPEAFFFNLTADQVEQTPTQANLAAVLDITHNVVSGQARDAIRYISRAQMDAQRPNWTREASSSTVKYWMPSQGEPRIFYVYPKPKAGVTVKGRAVFFPTSAANDTPVIRPALKSAMLHLATAYCFMQDDTPGDRENVATHLAMASGAMRAAGMADERIIQQIVNKAPPR